MKLLKPLFVLMFSASLVFGQSKKTSSYSNNSLQKLVETEQSFARTAEQKGTRTAFLEFLADDGILFSPTETNGKIVWQNRAESKSWLNWSPAWADVSSDGSLGYTTGGWSFHPKGVKDSAKAFGEYLTIWKKQPDGKFKAVLDIGISHEKPLAQIKKWKSPIDAGEGGAAKVETGINSGVLTDIFSKEILSQGYFNYFADDVVVLRDGNEPFHGKTNAFGGLEKFDKRIPLKSYLDFKANVSPVYGNMMYSHGVYQLTHKDKSISRWNFLQIWKYRAGKWQIVADVFTAVKEEES